MIGLIADGLVHHQHIGGAGIGTTVRDDNVDLAVVVEIGEQGALILTLQVDAVHSHPRRGDLGPEACDGVIEVCVAERVAVGQRVLIEQVGVLINQQDGLLLDGLALLADQQDVHVAVAVHVADRGVGVEGRVIQDARDGAAVQADVMAMKGRDGAVDGLKSSHAACYLGSPLLRKTRSNSRSG